MIPSAIAANSTVEYENISFGGGGAFFYPLINPTDSDSYVVFSNMGGIYYTTNAGKSWDRTNTATIMTACMSDDGVLFAGSNGLYASNDNGATLKLIYPREDTVTYSIDRLGQNNTLRVSNGYNNNYDNGLVVAVDTYGDYVYFVSIDWSGLGNLRLCRSKFDGSDFKILYTEQTGIWPSNLKCSMIVEQNCAYFCDGKTISRFDFNTSKRATLYSSTKAISEFKKIGNKFFFLLKENTYTNIVYTENFNSYYSLNSKNKLPNTFVKNGVNYAFGWNFTAIDGNSFDNIWIGLKSPVSGFGNISGVLKFDGTSFEWVYDNVFNTQSTDTDIGWTGGSVSTVHGLGADPNNKDHCIMSTIETIYDVHYDNNGNRNVKTLHCVDSGNGYYTTNGLDCQTTYFVREDPFDKKHIIICTTDWGLQISHDGGESFKRMHVTYQNIYNTCYDLYFDPVRKDVVYGLWSSRHDAPYTPALSDANAVGGFGISYDGGYTWDFSYSSGLPSNSIPVKMSVLPQGFNYIIAVATFNNGFFISYDSGKTFKSINKGMASYNGMIWGEDVVISGNDVFCLTASHSLNGDTPSALYYYNIKTGVTKTVDMGDIVTARSLTYKCGKGIFVNVTPTSSWEWIPSINRSFWVNHGGGVYKFNGNGLSLVVPIDSGAYGSDFTSDGTMYIAGELGTVYKLDNNGKVQVYADGLFRRLKNISFSNDESTMYVTTLGGGTYRMPTHKSSSVPKPTYYTVTFKNWDGTVLSTQSVLKGSSATLPKNPTRASDDTFHYVFKGWDVNTSSVSSNLTVTAEYSQYYHTPAYKTNNNGTHIRSCSVCLYVNGNRDCMDYDSDMHCDFCDYVMANGRFKLTYSLQNGKQYLITNSGYTFNQTLLPSSVKFTYGNSNHVFTNNLPKNVLWTYNNGYLYTTYNGQTYYLMINNGGNGNYSIKTTTNINSASKWQYTSGALSTYVGNSWRYMRIANNGISINTTASSITLYQVD